MRPTGVRRLLGPGDNGSSAEGQNGSISELLAQNQIPNTIAQQIKALDGLGGLKASTSPESRVRPRIRRPRALCRPISGP
jgi:hypothetical protein